MPDPQPTVPTAIAPTRWQRLHGWLMPDYNRQATGYWWAVVVVGLAVLVWALWDLSQRPAVALLQVAIGVGMAMLSGLVPVRIPGTKNSFAAGEIFIVLLLLLHGPAAAVLAASCETAIGAWRTSRRWSSRIASPAMSAVAMALAGSALQRALDTLTELHLNHAVLTVVAAMAFAPLYFVINASLVSTLPRLKRSERLQPADLIGVFGWVGFAYVGSAAVAVLLYLTYQQNGIGVLAAMVPLVGAMLAALHFFYRQQEAAEAVRQAGAEAAAREAELAARHVRELEASERRFHSAFTHASVGMALLDFGGCVLQANPALHALLGRPEGSLVGAPFTGIVAVSDRPTLQQQLGLVGAHEFEGFTLEMRCLHRDGSDVWVLAHCSFFSEPGTSAPCLIVHAQDVTARRKAEQDLHHLAFHDALTGLPNRRRFQQLLKEAVDRAMTDEHAAYAVMFLDFDRFKLINDSLGHEAGDEFLVQVSRRIREHLRPGDLVARLGGDEFAVLACPLEHERHAIVLAERVMAAMREPFHVGGTELMTSASIGITFSALGYTSPEDVLRDADTAMYKAKGAGKARYALFDASLHTEVAQRLRLEGDLRRAIDEGRLAVHYQPLFDLVRGQAVGCEALARWRHPVDGDISPGHFLPIAEEAGLMLRVSDFVLHCACRQLRAWQLALGPDCGLTMSVNISGQDIAQPTFVARVTRAIVEAGLRPQDLCLELTENILSARLEAALPVLHELRRLGVRLAIDDFGTGYSSLSHLSTLPIDELKIDRSFVTRLDDGPSAAAVVRSIVLLGQSLGKQVVAEGIETEEQLRQLRELGCRTGQGFLLAVPGRAEDVSSVLSAPLAALGGAAPGVPSRAAVVASTLVH
ncbi:MAG: EAL domain-containing protein [Rubrivivax sp.]|nr:EAL domain-containing protein [Rubrivivax sp.]